MSDSANSPRRILTGLAMVMAIGATIAMVVVLFRGGVASSVPIVVVSPRAGLVMNPDAKVKMRDIEVGRVSSIQDGPHGTAEIHLAMDPAQLALIPDNVRVDVSSSTVFGAKFVDLIPPSSPSRHALHAGQTVPAEHVTVEINTVFQQLTSVLRTIEPQKLNATLSALSTGLSGRGARTGNAIADFDALLITLNPHLDDLSHDLDAAPTAFESYADSAPRLLDLLDASTHLGSTIVDQRQRLDAFLVSAIGLADTGNDVLTANREPLTDLLHLLAPTTDLTNAYNQAIYCGIAGMLPLADTPPYKNPGVEVMAGFLWGAERWRYPDNLPKVAAKGGPQCTDMPRVPYQKRPPFVITDTNGNPWQYGNPGILLNSAGLKELLFGPIAGPPRNSAQIGQPG